GGAEVVMMLAGERLRVALATIHVSLRRALELLSPAVIESTIRITDAFFRKYMGTKSPRIAVAGVNPHAGEGGLFGDEEATMVAPAVAACRAAGIHASGPYPPDTVFHRAFRGGFDVVVAMTHDQGLIPLKLVHFEDGVNVTMGLPVIRTSVDHGTAYDIAGRGAASPESLLAAIRMAAGMAKAGR
ncbi:MAG: pdxA, partial [Actinobacteria bacterium]|nr:pdxA [Actinomycetota bacterium]